MQHLLILRIVIQQIDWVKRMDYHILVSVGSLYKIAFDALIRSLRTVCFVGLKQLQSNDEPETNYLGTGKIDISHRDEVPIERRALRTPNSSQQDSTVLIQFPFKIPNTEQNAKKYWLKNINDLLQVNHTF